MTHNSSIPLKLIIEQLQITDDDAPFIEELSLLDGDFMVSVSARNFVVNGATAITTHCYLGFYWSIVHSKWKLALALLTYTCCHNLNGLQTKFMAEACLNWLNGIPITNKNAQFLLDKCAIFTDL